MCNCLSAIVSIMICGFIDTQQNLSENLIYFIYLDYRCKNLNASNRDE